MAVPPIAETRALPLRCAGCGHDRFKRGRVIDDKLAADWALSAAERQYMDDQQGTRCLACGSSLRAIVLARAILRVFGAAEATLREAAGDLQPDLRILEINEAGELTQFLRRAPGHTLASYPDVDMQALPYGDGGFDLVVHSDTLEHVPDPVAGLRECRRVLRPGGALCYTVPTVVGRMTRSRRGLPPSHHVTYPVHTEFGADAWTFPLQAGFTRVAAETLLYPTAIALTAS